MKAYFIKYKNDSIKESQNCNAIDIVMDKYTIRIRENGLLIKDNKTQEEKYNIDL